VFCSQCGTQAQGGARFCVNCGQAIAGGGVENVAAAAPVVAAPVAVPVSAVAAPAQPPVMGGYNQTGQPQASVQYSNGVPTRSPPTRAPVAHANVCIPMETNLDKVNFHNRPGILKAGSVSLTGVSSVGRAKLRWVVLTRLAGTASIELCWYITKSGGVLEENHVISSSQCVVMENSSKSHPYGLQIDLGRIHLGMRFDTAEAERDWKAAFEAARTGAPFPVRKHGSVFQTCSKDGCSRFCHRTGEFCPLHAPKRVHNKDAPKAYSCPLCYREFSLTLPRHHCGICDYEFCFDCCDHRMDRSDVKLYNLDPFLAKKDQNKSSSVNVCTRCTALLQPGVQPRFQGKNFDSNLHLPIRRQAFEQLFANVSNAISQQVHWPLDLVFVFDSTCSMTRYISNVEENIDEIVNDIDRHHYLDMRVAAVAYRDHQYGGRLVDTIPFQTHHGHFERMVDHIRAFAAYNNDLAEAPADGLREVRDSLVFRPLAAKLVVLITDAPAHGHAGNPRLDSYAAGCPCGDDPLALVNELAREGVVTYTIGVEPHISNFGGQGMYYLQQLAQCGRGKYVPLLPHHHLHHCIAAAACEVVLRFMIGHTMDDMQQESTNPVDRQKLYQRALRNLKPTNYGMPRFVQGTSGVHRGNFTEREFQQYIDQANSDRKVLGQPSVHFL